MSQKIMHTAIRRTILLSLVFLFTAIPAMAEDAAPPEPGKILDSVKTPPPKRPEKPPQIDLLKPDQAVAAEEEGVRIQVDGFAIAGMTVFSEEGLLALVSPLSGKELSLGDLRRAAERITQHYRDHGYFASYAYLPAQDIVDNRVRINVLEGKIGKVNVNEGIRLKEMVVLKSLGPAASAPVAKAGPLEKGLLLVNDLPGVQVRARLEKGEQPETADLYVNIEEGGVVSGYVGFDDYGSPYVGDDRLMASLDLNNLVGYGDQFSIRAMSAGNGMIHAGLHADFPVHFASGTRMGLYYSRMDYEVRKEYRFLESEGLTQEGGVFLRYPWIRSRNVGVTGEIGLDFKKFEQEVQGALSRQDKPIIGKASITTTLQDRFGGGGANFVDFRLRYGNNDYDSEVFDGPSPDDDAFFSASMEASRLQRIGRDWSVFVSFLGQYSDDRLISSERFSLGGPYKVRAYPQGEGDGDKGYVLSGELRYDIPGAAEKLFGTSVQAVGFIETGMAYLNQGNLDTDLSGAGLGFNLYNSDLGVSVKLHYAHRLGSHEITVEPDDDKDRFWFQIVHFYDF